MLAFLAMLNIKSMATLVYYMYQFLLSEYNAGICAIDINGMTVNVIFRSIVWEGELSVIPFITIHDAF